MSHDHYHKDVRHLEKVDIYRFLKLFNVTDPCIQHAVKKLMVAGGRGAGKSFLKDVQEAIDSLERCKEMVAEDDKPRIERITDIYTVGPELGPNTKLELSRRAQEYVHRRDVLAPDKRIRDIMETLSR